METTVMTTYRMYRHARTKIIIPVNKLVLHVAVMASLCSSHRPERYSYTC